MKTRILRNAALVVVMVASLALSAHAAETKPNILIIWGDDIGQFNISAYNMGMMGYKTPNIDSIGQAGAVFTDWYGQQSCTAGRAAFITGQSPIRTGLTKVGLPGAKEGLTKDDPTLAELLKPHGYVTGQFGKNHVGDRNEMLPTVHGFDEWLGNLYHLNAEEEPENVDYPGNLKMPNGKTFRENFGPRGVMHCYATDKDDPTVDPRFGKVGKQKCEDTGPLTRKRMETVDEEVTAAALKFMDKSAKDGKPFFVWWNSSRMHVFTHLKKESEGKTGFGVYADGMVEHDGQVGQLLSKLKELGIDNNTIVMYSTDNGAETFGWPDGGKDEGRPAQREEDRRHDLQGPPRRLQPASLLERRSEGVAASRVRLLDGRRQRRRAALRQLQGHLSQAERSWHACLAGAFRSAARPAPL